MCVRHQRPASADTGGDFALKHGQQVKAVLRSIGRQFRAGDRGDGGHHIDEAGELIAVGAGFHFARPADDERHAMAAFPRIALHAAPRSRAVVTKVTRMWMTFGFGFPDGYLDEGDELRVEVPVFRIRALRVQSFICEPLCCAARFAPLPIWQ